MRTGFEEIQHTADWALKVWAPDFVHLLVQAALGMNHLMGVVTAPDESVIIDFSIEDDDDGSMLVAFLNRILYALETDSVGFAHFSVMRDGKELHAHLEGGRVVEIHKMIKAVTYHNLVIRQVEDGLETVLVFDV